MDNLQEMRLEHEKIMELYSKTIGPMERFRPARLNYLHKKIHELFAQSLALTEMIKERHNRTIVYEYPVKIGDMDTELLLPLHISLAEMTDNQARNERIAALEPHIRERILIMARIMREQAEEELKITERLIEDKRKVREEIAKIMPEYEAEVAKYSQQTKDELAETLLKHREVFERLISKA